MDEMDYSDLVYDSFKKLERQFSSNSMVSFKAGKKPEHEYEKPIRSIIDNLVVNHYKCCNRSAKINPLLKMSCSFCPFCGVISFADE